MRSSAHRPAAASNRGSPLSAAKAPVSWLVGQVVELLFPLSCVVCRREGRFLCDTCGTGLPKLGEHRCVSCANPEYARLCPWCDSEPPYYETIRAPYLMDGPVREMVSGLKYRNLRAWAPHMGRIMGAHLAFEPLPADVLAPVPLHRRRERQRGYNQSDLLAREVSRWTGIPLEPRILARTRDTAPQVSMSSNVERRRNIEGAFECTGSVEGRKVLLIDDVVTTGATMNACARALMEGGAEVVWGLSLAR